MGRKKKEYTTKMARLRKDDIEKAKKIAKRTNKTVNQVFNELLNKYGNS